MDCVNELPISPNNSLANKTILITGAAGKLGSIASKACAKQGATVILLDKEPAKLESVYDEITASGAPKPALYPLDLEGANEQHYLELAETVEREFGMLHGLVHNAAKFSVLGPIDNINISSWSSTMNVNLNAPYLLTRVLLPLMRAADEASVVFTSDSSARTAKAYWGVYSVSKIAVEAFAKILADELESGGLIRVNTLVPGPIDSPIRKLSFPAENSSSLSAAESLEKVYIYLLSSASRGKTGLVFEADSLK